MGKYGSQIQEEINHEPRNAQAEATGHDKYLDPGA